MKLPSTLHNLQAKAIKLYHKTKGAIIMKFNKKVFEAKNPFVKMFVREVLRKSKTIEQVPDIGNLREVVSAEVDRIERNSQESHKSTEAPKEVV